MSAAGIFAGAGGGAGGAGHALDPVSYTHLDVYKRQSPVTAMLLMRAAVYRNRLTKADADLDAR